jgi:hypothetical protein
MGGMTVQTTSGKQIMGVFGISLIVYLAGAGVVPAAAAEIDASGYPRLESFTTKAGTAFGGYTPPPATATAWDGYAQSLGNNWYSGWLGHYAPMGDNWIWHNFHAFLWIAPGSTVDSTWMFSFADQSWFWTNYELYGIGLFGPWPPDAPHTQCCLYSAADGAWLFYLPGTKDPRWFFNFSTGQWFSRP